MKQCPLCKTILEPGYNTWCKACCDGPRDSNDFPIPTIEMHERAFEEDNQCPSCPHGLVEHSEFGSGDDKEIYSTCFGLNDDEDDGCGWSEHYKAAPKKEEEDG